MSDINLESVNSMRMYSLYDGYKWVSDSMTIDDITAFIGCSKKRVISAIHSGYSINGRYGIVFEGEETLKKGNESDQKMLISFDEITNHIKELAGYE